MVAKLQMSVSQVSMVDWPQSLVSQVSMAFGLQVLAVLVAGCSVGSPSRLVSRVVAGLGYTCVGIVCCAVLISPIRVLSPGTGQRALLLLQIPSCPTLLGLVLSDFVYVRHLPPLGAVSFLCVRPVVLPSLDGGIAVLLRAGSGCQSTWGAVCIYSDVWV